MHLYKILIKFYIYIYKLQTYFDSNLVYTEFSLQ